MTSLFQAEPDLDDSECRRSRRSRRLQRKLKGRADGELNIVSMIDVFAVLVFFLLVGSSISASKLHTLNLTIPLASNSSVETKKDFYLTVALHKDKVVISQTGNETSFSHINGTVDSTSLAELLKTIKADYPAEEKVSLLVDDSVAYEQIIRVMDSIRMYPSAAEGSTGVTLFPAISMGDIAAVSRNNSEIGGK